MLRKRLLPAFLALLPVVLVLTVFYGNVLMNANHTFFGRGGDNMKNYYTPSYHVKHDQSYTWFDGMNYPYGEHLLFTDGQPLLSNGLKLISDTVFDVSDYTVGIINWLMLLSVLGAAWFSFLILRKFGVQGVIAGLGAAAIALLSPQLMRTSGHYALAYSFFFPLIWYLLLRAFENLNWKNTGLLSSVLFLFAWLHPYFLMIGLIFGACFWFWALFRGSHPFKKGIMHFGVQFVLPVLLFRLLLVVTDPVSDRPATPEGHSLYTASWSTLFVPYNVHGMEWMTDMFPKPEEQSDEGFAYIGFAATLVFFMFIAWWLWRMFWHTRRHWGRDFFKGKKGRILRRRMAPSRNPALSFSVLAGLMIMLFSVGWPFTDDPTEWARIFTPLRQFRSLGRFAWVFYYTWGIFSVYLIWILSRKLTGRKLKVVAIGICSLFFLFYAWEVRGYHLKLKEHMHVMDRSMGEPSEEEKSLTEWTESLNPEDYSGLWILPYFHIGSENFNAYEYGTAEAGFLMSYRTGLPLLNVMMSRASFSQTWKHLEMSLEPYRQLEILEDMPLEKPLLAVIMGDQGQYHGSHIKDRGKALFKNERMEIYEIGRKTLENMVPDVEAIMAAAPDTMFRYDDNFFANKRDPILFRQAWDDKYQDKSYIGGGSNMLPMSHQNVVFDSSSTIPKSRQIVTSTWARIRKQGRPMTDIGVEGFAPNGDLKLWEYASAWLYVRVLDGEWALLEKTFWTLSDSLRTLVVYTQNRQRTHVVEFDEFWIKMKGTDVYGFIDEKFFLNGRTYPLPSDTARQHWMDQRVFLKR